MALLVCNKPPAEAGHEKKKYPISAARSAGDPATRGLKYQHW